MLAPLIKPQTPLSFPLPFPRTKTPPGRRISSSEPAAPTSISARFRPIWWALTPSSPPNLLLLTLHFSLIGSLIIFCSRSMRSTNGQSSLPPARLQPPLPLTSGSNWRSWPSPRAPLVELIPVVASPSSGSHRSLTEAHDLATSPDFLPQI
jgi:hypothetical protein